METRLYILETYNALLEAQLGLVIKEYPNIPEKVIKTIYNTDPSRGEIFDFLIDSYERDPREFNQYPSVGGLMARYRKYSHLLRPLPELFGLKNLECRIDQARLEQDNPIIHKRGDNSFRELHSQEAAIYFGDYENTDFCTARPGGSTYNRTYPPSKGRLFLIYYKGNISAQLFVAKSGSMELKDHHNEPITDPLGWLDTYNLLKPLRSHGVDIDDEDRIVIGGHSFTFERSGNKAIFDDVALYDTAVGPDQAFPPNSVATRGVYLEGCDSRDLSYLPREIKSYLHIDECDLGSLKGMPELGKDTNLLIRGVDSIRDLKGCTTECGELDLAYSMRGLRDLVGGPKKVRRLIIDAPIPSYRGFPESVRDYAVILPSKAVKDLTGVSTTIGNDLVIGMNHEISLIENNIKSVRGDVLIYLLQGSWKPRNMEAFVEEVKLFCKQVGAKRFYIKTVSNFWNDVKRDYLFTRR